MGVITCWGPLGPSTVVQLQRNPRDKRPVTIGKESFGKQGYDIIGIVILDSILFGKKNFDGV
jgi:hypothetical protein